MINTKIISEKLISFSVNKYLKIDIHIDGWITLLVLCIIFIYFLFKLFSNKSFKNLQVDEVELGIGKQKVKIRPNLVDMQIAYKIWVELSTRKIGLVIDFDNDVISEIYDSWYTFFSVTRELIKDVPVSKFRRPDTEKIIKISIEVLNSGIRPHLTMWQAKFRKWYSNEILKKENIGKSPQDIQKEFPEYEKLCCDLKIINAHLINYRTKMHDLISLK